MSPSHATEGRNFAGRMDAAWRSKTPENAARNRDNAPRLLFPERGRGTLILFPLPIRSILTYCPELAPRRRSSLSSCHQSSHTAPLYQIQTIRYCTVNSQLNPNSCPQTRCFRPTPITLKFKLNTSRTVSHLLNQKVTCCGYDGINNPCHANATGQPFPIAGGTTKMRRRRRRRRESVVNGGVAVITFENCP